LTEKDFIAAQSSNLQSEGIKIFPEDFCDLSDAAELNLPEENLVLGKDFFGSFEITTTSGEPVFTVTDQSEAKFIVYSSKKRSKQIKIPKDSNTINDAVNSYESYIDQLLTNIKKEYHKKNLDIKNIGIVSGEILKKLNLSM
jgi:hypothetical protein